MCIAGENFVTMGEAAAYLATTETRILLLLKTQELRGKQVEDAWFVDKASLQLCGKPKPSDFGTTGCGGGCGSGGCAGQ
ncbi:hypothetical protein [Trichlorobacter ammonificans]|uniref:DNA-binding protein n=1 Tax=Trichlorobacter ammonificans TaxID=2916410 RepID=A0ABM9D623_9BACT|nr:hypothetical protein [Trichlorobacter ammonificans]CAH2029870.1 conserved protein of unknown function [Trichlorobacter ammonificans]